MSEFLSNFMQFALKVTNSERGLAVDTNLNAQGSIALDAKALSSQSFNDLAAKVLHDALTTGTPIITNNIITDPSEAPKTNTSFSDLRIVVGIPLEGIGAIYLDRPIKFGVIGRDLIEKLTNYGKQLVQHSTTQLSPEEMNSQFGAMN